jgi:hypothetical protein
MFLTKLMPHLPPIYTGCSMLLSLKLGLCLYNTSHRPNVPLSADRTSRILDLNKHTKYIPPHPQRGTNYHRYILLLLQQPPHGASQYSLNIEARAKPNEPTSVHLDIPVVSDRWRKGFDLRGFMREWGFDMREGGGAHMWREVWDEHVSTVYKDILSTRFTGARWYQLIKLIFFRNAGTPLRTP